MNSEPKPSAMPSARVISQKQVFERYFSLEVLQAEPRSLKHDGYAMMIEREVMRIGEVAAILPYCPETDEILLNQQFRMGAFLAGDPEPFMFECAAGGIDDGETPEEAARREALEETGVPILDIESAGWFYTSPGTLDEKVHSFVGRIARPKAGLHGLEHEGEEIRTHLLPAADVIDMLYNGGIRNSVSMHAVHWFARNRDRLKKKWDSK
jgi:ADP-ribose pyrophosphatase